MNDLKVGTRLRIKLCFPRKGTLSMHALCLISLHCSCLHLGTSPTTVTAARISFNRSRSSLSGRPAARDWSVNQNKTYTIDCIYLRVHASDAYLIHALLCQYFLCDIIQGGRTFWETEAGSPPRWMSYAKVSLKPGRKLLFFSAGLLCSATVLAICRSQSSEVTLSSKG